MKAEHISIAQSLEDIPHVETRTAMLLRDAGVLEPEDLRELDALWLYNKICSITRQNHGVWLLDILLAAIDFANGSSPKQLTVFSKKRETVIASRPINSND